MMKRPLMLLCSVLLLTLSECKGGTSSSTGLNSGESGGTGMGSGKNGSGGIIPMPTGGTPGSGGASSLRGTGGSTSAATATATGSTNVASGGIIHTGGVATGGTARSDGGSAGGMIGTGGTSAKGLTLYYIRHAEVAANTADAGQVSTNDADTITELGQRQISALSTYLQGMTITPDAVLVSPAPRAQNTISPYLVAKSLTGEVWMDLTEASNASSTGASLPAAPIYYTYYKATIVAQNLVFRDTNATQYWQNNTYEAGVLMVATAKNEILARFGQSGKTIIVVGHAIAGEIMIGLLLGQDMLAGPTSTGPTAVYLLNTGIMKMVQDPTTGAFALVGRNINNPATK